MICSRLQASSTRSALQALGDGYRIILRRQDPARILLGNIMQFRFPEEKVQSPIAALQRIFAGVHVPVEVFHVNMTALSAHSLCSPLQDFNPGMPQVISHYKSVRTALYIKAVRAPGTESARQKRCCWLAGIKFCEEDGPITLDAPSPTPNDPMYGQQTNLQTIKAPTVWAGGQMGSAQVRILTKVLQKLKPALHAGRALYRGACCHCITKHTRGEQSKDPAAPAYPQGEPTHDAPANNLNGS